VVQTSGEGRGKVVSRGLGDGSPQVVSSGKPPVVVWDGSAITIDIFNVFVRVFLVKRMQHLGFSAKTQFSGVLFRQVVH